mmetsp:Transcript_56113/g.109851  ORF Transcript_56113/g.109851 Transcript_56113/m.109851 type:complete len:140 (-) Transcript_56113:1497-1916(-)
MIDQSGTFKTPTHARRLTPSKHPNTCRHQHEMIECRQGYPHLALCTALVCLCKTLIFKSMNQTFPLSLHTEPPSKHKPQGQKTAAASDFILHQPIRSIETPARLIGAPASQLDPNERKKAAVSAPHLTSDIPATPPVAD